MPAQEKFKQKLKTACWEKGLTISELARQLGISRQTAYHAWLAPEKFPLAAPRIFNRLKISQD